MAADARSPARSVGRFVPFTEEGFGRRVIAQVVREARAAVIPDTSPEKVRWF